MTKQNLKGQTDIFENVEVETEKRGRGRPAKEVKAKKQSFFIEENEDETLSFVSASFGMTKSRFVNALAQTLLQELLLSIGYAENEHFYSDKLTEKQAQRMLAFFENYGFKLPENSQEVREKIIKKSTKQKSVISKVNYGD
jgi:predicted ArsR family transcriptional regulator